MRLFYVLIFIIQIYSASAQETNLTVSGEIFNSEGLVVNNCAVKISDLRTKQIYNFFNTKESNRFTEKLTRKTSDSLLISIYHTSYGLFECKVPVSDNAIKIKAILQEKTNELKTVEIKAPKTWIRGDTTFFKVDAYKEGDERKLKDILLKLPDFSLNEQGKMLFKNKPLNKVTIDNEEMFSDKIELLLNSFPVHVLNTIQAMENQSNQKLLNGLDGGSNVFLNLSLKEEAKIKTAFGDTELGFDNLGRYNFSPVVFSMYGKLKVGFIGNWNKIGNGVSKLLESELKNKYENTASGFLMDNNSLTLINNFENRWYVKNNQWDNRLQLNTKLSSKIKSSFQISYVKDKQEQSTYNNSQLYTENTYVNRTDSNLNLYRPKIFSVKESITFNLDSLSELNVITSVYLDQSKGNIQSAYNGLDIKSPLKLNTQNNWYSYSLISNYTRRNSQNKASTFYLNLNTENIRQTGIASSTDIGLIFDINPAYNSMGNQINSIYTNISLGWSDLLKTKRGGIFNYGLLASYTSLKLNNLNYFENQPFNDDSFGSILNQHGGNYSVYNITGDFTKSFKLFLNKPFFLKASLGINKVIGAEQDRNEEWNGFIADISISHKHRFGKNVSAEFKGSFIKKPIEINQLNQFFYPTALTSFSKYNNQALQPEIFNIVYAFQISPFNDVTSFAFSAVYNKNLRNQISINTYNRFLQYNNNYNISTSTQNINFNGKITYPALWINSVIDFRISYNLGGALMLYNGEIVKSKFKFSLTSLSIKKNWDKKIYLKIMSGLLNQSAKLPTGSNKIVSTFLTDLNQRYIINPRISIASSGKLLVQDIGKASQANFMLVDAELSYNLKNKPLFFSLKADNLTNQKTYYYYYNSDQLLNFGSIPLIQRSFYINAKYNF